MSCEEHVTRMDRCDVHTKSYSENLKERIFFEVQTIVREGKVKTCPKVYGEKIGVNLKQGCQNLGVELCTLAPNICGSYERNLLHSVCLVPRILKCFLNFW